MIPELLGIFRIFFGLLFLLFVPGFALVLALFPRKEDLAIMERIGFAGALSIVADMLTTLFIDLVLHIPTTAVNIIIALLILTGLALLIWRGELFFMRLFEKKRGAQGVEEDNEKR